MGLGLSLRTVFELARVTVPTFGEALVGRVTRDKVDERIAAFSRRVIEHARIALSVEGLEHVPREGAFVYMSNHQSHIDIPVLYAVIPTPTMRMVAKTELFKIPVWGPAMRAADFVEVDRGDRQRAIASLQRAAEQLANGVSIWIAPEGSRSRTGEVGPLKKGGFHLAADTGAAIVPIAISGTHHILPPGAKRMRRDVPVHVAFGPPIESKGRTVAELMDEVATFLQANVRAD